MILRELFLGLSRFTEMEAHLGVSKAVLAERLQQLEAAGLIERVPYREPGRRTHAEYAITGKGRDLYPILVALKDWGERYLLDPDGPPVVTRHRDCGGRIGVTLRCEHGHDGLTAGDVVREAGPGARLRGDR